MAVDKGAAKRERERKEREAARAKAKAEPKKDPWASMPPGTKRYFTETDEGKRLLAMAGGDPVMAYNGWASMTQANTMLKDPNYDTVAPSLYEAFTRETGVPTEAEIANLDQGLADIASNEASIPGIDAEIARQEGDAQGFRGDVTNAREMIARADQEDPLFRELYNEALKQQRTTGQVDPTTLAAINKMMAESSGYSPERMAAARMGADLAVQSQQRQAQRTLSGALGARGLGGGALASAMGRMNSDYQGQRATNEAQLAADSATYGAGMLKEGGNLSFLANKAAQERVNAAINNTLSILGNENVRRNAAIGNATNFFGTASDALAKTGSAMSVNRGTRANILQGAAEGRNQNSIARNNTYNSAQARKLNGFNLYNGYQGQQAGYGYQGLMGGLATGATIAANNQNFDLGMQGLKVAAEAANKPAPTPTATTNYNITYPTVTGA